LQPISSFSCRSECGACCIALSISSPLPGHPNGKPAGVPCAHLSPKRACLIYRDPLRPEVCRRFAAQANLCGTSFAQAMAALAQLESATST
jgi:Fe-S-cluster containining protein